MVIQMHMNKKFWRKAPTGNKTATGWRAAGMTVAGVMVLSTALLCFSACTNNDGNTMDTESGKQTTAGTSAVTEVPTEQNSTPLVGDTATDHGTVGGTESAPGGTTQGTDSAPNT
jgi:hypothetical protein